MKDTEMLTTGNFTIQAQMPMGKTITVSGYIYANQDLSVVNKQVDFMHDVIDRQRIRSEIPELEAKMDQRQAALSHMRDALAELEEKQSGGERLSSAENKMIGEMYTNIDRINDDIEKGKVAITEAKESLK